MPWSSKWESFAVKRENVSVLSVCLLSNGSPRHRPYGYVKFLFVKFTLCVLVHNIPGTQELSDLFKATALIYGDSEFESTLA